MCDKTNNIDLDDLITKSTAARLRGVSRQTIRTNLLSNPERFDIVKIDNVPFLRRSQVLNFTPHKGNRRKKVD